MEQFLVDDGGAFSCMRLMCLLVLLVILGMWVWGCFRTGAFIPLGYGEAGVISSAMLGKVAQSRFEYGPGAGGFLL